MSINEPGSQPTPTTDPEPEVGPGGIDAVPDWEGAAPDPVTPDQPRSAQVEESDVPDEIEEPEASDEESDGAEGGEGAESKTDLTGDDADGDAVEEPEQDSPA